MARVRAAVAHRCSQCSSPWSASGCGGKQLPKLSSAWPTASAERVVPKPPTPPRWPLTGLPHRAPRPTKRRALSIKIENSDAARPQTGLQSADVVYEEVTEGGITRFNAIFQSKLPKVVGPVRSLGWPTCGSSRSTTRCSSSRARTPESTRSIKRARTAQPLRGRRRVVSVLPREPTATRLTTSTSTRRRATRRRSAGRWRSRRTRSLCVPAPTRTRARRR